MKYIQYICLIVPLIAVHATPPESLTLEEEVMMADVIVIGRVVQITKTELNPKLAVTRCRIQINEYLRRAPGIRGRCLLGKKATITMSYYSGPIAGLSNDFYISDDVELGAEGVFLLITKGKTVARLPGRWAPLSQLPMDSQEQVREILKKMVH